MFSESDRAIFGPYYNGVGMVYADPLAVQRRLNQALGGDINDALRRAKAPEAAVKYEAREQLLTAARSALNLAPFDPATGRGALEADAWAALNAFLDFVEKKNQRGVTSPTPVPPTVPPASSDPARSLDETDTGPTLLSFLPSPAN